MTAPNPPAGTQRSAVEDAAMARERSAYLRSMADHYTDRFHPDISYLLGASNMLGAFADRIEAASAPPSLDARIAEAHDQLGGMYSWHDAYLDDPNNQHLWVTRAARLLREVVGRPARNPDVAYSEASAEPKDGGE